MSIITLGLDPIDSKVITQGYGPDVTIEVEVGPPTTLGRQIGIGGGGLPRKRYRDITIRVRDKDGKLLATFEIDDADDFSKILRFKLIDILNSELLSEKVSVVVKERVEKGETKFKFNVKDIKVKEDSDED